MSITIAYTCQSCGSREAVLQRRADAASLVKCAGCSREHGSLHEIRQELLQLARQSAAERAEQVLRTVWRHRAQSPPGVAGCVRSKGSLK
jgi:predicted nucleic acid-binding Zn ribbon protein